MAPVVALLLISSCIADPSNGPDPDALVVAITFDAASVNRLSNRADIWPTTWAADGWLYTAGGDGNGWDGVDTRGLDVNRLTLAAPTDNLAANGTEVYRARNVLPKGLIAVGDALYLVAEERGNGFARSRIGRSTDNGVTWSFLVTGGDEPVVGGPDSDWTYREPDGAFHDLTFAQAGQAHADAPDAYVYGIGGGSAGTVWLMRCLASADLRDPANHEYFAGLDGAGAPTWTGTIGTRRPVLTRSGGIHWGPTMAYNPVLRRYLLPLFIDTNATLAVYEAPQPWGPWSLVQTITGLGGDTTEKFTLNFINKPGFLSADGKTWWATVSGLNAWDSFNLIQATLTTR